MSQLFRITFEQKDYAFKLLNVLPLSKETEYIDIMLDGTNYQLVRHGGSWVFDNITDHHLIKLSIAIGKSISTRYRI